MNGDKMVFYADNLTHDDYSNTTHMNVQQEQTTHNSLYPLANSELHLNYDLEDQYGINDWKSTNCHKNKLIITYNNRARNNTLHPKVFYVLYIEPYDDNNGHLIYDLLRDKIVVTTNYQLVPVPADLFEPTNKTESSNNKIQVDHFDVKHSIVWMDYSNNNEYKNRSLNNNEDDSENEDTDESGNSQYLDNLMSDKIVDHED